MTLAILFALMIGVGIVYYSGSEIQKAVKSGKVIS